MLTLHVPDEIQTGSVALSWCIGKDLLEKLAQTGIVDPQLVIVIALKGKTYPLRQENRIVVPLRDLMTFVSFHRPGEHNIFAFIAGTHYQKVLRNFVYARQGGQYDNDILDYDGEAILSSLRAEIVWGDTVLTVNIPTRCFAKEPPAWEKPWVNWLLSGRADNTCAYGKRRSFAYSLQIPLAAVIYLIRIGFTTFLLLCTFRGINFRPLFHLLQESTLDISSNLSTPLVIPRTENVLRKMFFVPLMPILWMPGFLISFTSNGWNWDGLYGGLIISTFIGIIFFTAFGIVGVNSLIESLPRSWRTWREGRNKKEDVEQEVKELWYTSPEEQALLNCANGPRRQICDLPHGRRTIRLRYLDLKAKKCKPFAR